VIRSSENQTDGVGSRTLHPLVTPSLTIQWKLDCRSRKQKRKNKLITMSDSGPCDWLVLLLLLPTPTFHIISFYWIINDGVVNGIGRNGNVDSSDSNFVELMTPLTTLIFDFHQVMRALTTWTPTTTTTPSLVKTSLKFKPSAFVLFVQKQNEVERTRNF